jgi:prolyl-tRNA synthetase
VFDLGEKYTRAFGLIIENEKGEKIYPIMGCYGIGISRTMGVIVEKFNDEKGIVWPKSIAPFEIHLIALNYSKLSDWANKVYEELTHLGVEVLLDDREVPAGEKFADADLIGIPIRLVLSERNMDKIEWKERNSDAIEMLSVNEVIKRLK